MELKLTGLQLWVEPLKGDFNDKNACSLIAEYVRSIAKYQMKIGTDSGVLLRKKDREWNAYLYCSIEEIPNEIMEYSQKITIPDGDFVCQRVREFDLKMVQERALSLIAEEDIEEIMIQELHTRKYNYEEPEYVIIIHLKSK